MKNKLRVPFKPAWAKKIVATIYQIHHVSYQRRMKASAPSEILGVKVPKNVKEAFEFDEENGNTLWRDAIDKEMNSLLCMGT